MEKWWRKFYKKKVLKFKSLLVEGKYKIVPAFIWDGIQYYCFEDVMNMPAGRGLSAMAIYQEFEMKCDKEYLELHIRAMDLLLAGKDGNINLQHLMAMKEINNNLRERINLAALPDHCFKLASVYFFDADENVMYYDSIHNEKKIAGWKQNPETLSFFLTQPLKNFLPFLNSANHNVETYLKVAEKVAAMGRKRIQEVLSKKV